MLVDSKVSRHGVFHSLHLIDTEKHMSKKKIGH